MKRLVVWTLAIALGGFAAGCSKKPAAPPEPSGAFEDAVVGSPGDSAPSPPVAPPPAAPPVELVVPGPQAIPDDLPTYATIAEIPEDAYEVAARLGDKPATIVLEADAVLQGKPCAGGANAMFYDGETLAECTLAIDFEVDGIPLQRGTILKFQPDGRFTGFQFPRPQAARGLPLAADTLYYLTPRGELQSAKLAAAATIQGIALPAGTWIDFDVADERHRMRSAKLGATTRVEGRAYEAGVRLYFGPEAQVTMIRGRARPPTAASGCPADNVVEVESMHGGYPADLDWSTIRGAFVHLDDDAKGIDDNRVVWVVLTNFEPPPGFDLWRATLAEGQGLVKLEVGRWGDGRIAIGTYEVGPHDDNDFRVLPALGVAGGTTLSFDLWETEGRLEVTEATPERLCGVFELRDGRTRLRGRFAAGPLGGTEEPR